MSLILMAQALKIKVGNPLRKLVLIKLCDNANDEGVCWPSHSNIADHCEVTSKSVQNHIKALKEAGFLTVENRVSNNKKQSNKYQLNVEKLCFSTERDSLVNRERDSHGTEGDSPSDREGDSDRTSHSSEPVIESIYQFWKETFGKTKGKLSDSVRKHIRARMEDGYTPDDLKNAIIGCTRSAWHMGENPQGKKYIALSLIFRSSEKIDQFLDYLNTEERKQAYESNHSSTSQKSTSGVTASDVFAMRESANDDEGGEISSATIREINPDVPNGVHQSVSGCGAFGQSESGMGQGFGGGPSDTAANEDRFGQHEASQTTGWQAESVSTESSGVSGAVPSQGALVDVEPAGAGTGIHPDFQQPSTVVEAPSSRSVLRRQ